MGDVTVVVPFWNLDPKILRDCVDSVRSQTEACEILIVDNCSANPVLQLPGTNVLRLNVRASVGEARNIGLQHVTTPYVMFMDADDVLLPGALRHLLGLMRSNPKASLAAGGIVDWIAETGYRGTKNWPGALAHKINSQPRFFRAINAVRNMTPVTGCALVNTAMAKASNGFPDSTAEDWTFGVSMSFRGAVILSTQNVKLYRWRADGLSKQAVEDTSALLEARKVTRQAIVNDVAAPSWLRSSTALLALLHAIELPFHIRRERRLSDVQRIDTAVIPRRVPTSVPRVRPAVASRVSATSAQTGSTLAKAIGLQTDTVSSGDITTKLV